MHDCGLREPSAARLLVSASVIGALLGCGPSAERIACMNYCATENDKCLLDATATEEVRACDAQTQRCVRSCPAR